MTDLKSAVWIAPVADVTATKTLTGSDEVGYRAGFTVPLSVTGTNPATHFGQHSWEDARMLGFMRGTNQPRIKGRTRGEVKAATDKLSVSVSTTLSNRAHFDAAIAAAGLKIIQAKV